MKKVLKIGKREALYLPDMLKEFDVSYHNNNIRVIEYVLNQSFIYTVKILVNSVSMA